MPDPILTEVAVAAAGEATKALVAGGRTALTALAGALRRKVAGRHEDEAAVRALASDPNDQQLADRVIQLMLALAANDVRFAALLAEAREDRRVELRASEGSTINYVGQAAKVVQVHDNHGNISL